MLDGPLDIIATRSPSCSRSCTSWSTIRLTCGVYSASMWTSSMKMTTTRPATFSTARRAFGNTMPSGAAAASGAASPV